MNGDLKYKILEIVKEEKKTTISDIHKVFRINRAFLSGFLSEMVDNKKLKEIKGSGKTKIFSLGEIDPHEELIIYSIKKLRQMGYNYEDIGIQKEIGGFIPDVNAKDELLIECLTDPLTSIVKEKERTYSKISRKVIFAIPEGKGIETKCKVWSFPVETKFRKVTFVIPESAYQFFEHATVFANLARVKGGKGLKTVSDSMRDAMIKGLTTWKEINREADKRLKERAKEELKKLGKGK